MIRRTRIKAVSEKRKAELAEYSSLEDRLCLLCGNKSELSGDAPDWQTDYFVEGHHITGRNGKRLLDPFGIIMVTRPEHDRIWEYSKETLLQMIRPLRIKQGFEEGK